MENRLGWGAAVLLLAFAGSASLPAQTTLLAEPFDVDLGEMNAANDGAGTNAWTFDSTCPATALAGHTIAGTAHWINPTTCLDYGTEGSSDLLTSDVIDVSDCRGGVEVRFNYYLDFQESDEYDRARALVRLDGGTDVVVAANHGGGGGERPAGDGGSNPPSLFELENDATWRSVAVIVPGSENASQAQLAFVGETEDGIANSGEGFLIDDVEVICRPAAYEVPALDGAGLAALVALLAAAALVAMARRRRNA